MDSNTLILLNEAYRHGVYNEETLSEEEMLSVEEWVETLIDEGYDLDQYTDEELYEAYLEEKSTVMKVVSPKGEERSLNVTKAPPSRNLEGAERRKAIQDISQERVDRSFADPRKVSKFRRRHGISEEVDLDEAYLEELYQGKHGQSATQYMAGRSDAGKRISGDDKTGPRFYTLGRSRGAVPDAPTQPGARPVNTPKMSKDEKTYHLYRKSESKKRTAAGYGRVGGSKGLPEELDLYDIVSEYLISEGFCDSYEDADVIMANMSEEWRDSIMEEVLDEAKVDSGLSRVEKKVARRGRLASQVNSGRREPLNTDELEQGRQWRHLQFRGVKKPEAKSRPTGPGKYGAMQRRKRMSEELDLYDIVSEYLISEGFCDSYEDADVIMANMSEEWREDILEKAGTSGR